MRHILGWGALLATFAIPAWAGFFIPNGTVTQAKLATRPSPTPSQASLGGVAESSTSGHLNKNSTSEADLDNLSVTLNTNGRPVALFAVSDNGASEAMFELTGADSVSVQAYLYWDRDGSNIQGFSIGIGAGSSPVGTFGAFYPPGVVNTVDFTAAGTHTYKLRYKVTNSSYALQLWGIKIVAWEI